MKIYKNKYFKFSEANKKQKLVKVEIDPATNYTKKSS